MTSGIKFTPLVDTSRLDFSNSLFITGFHGFGLVGYLTTLHLVQELGLSKVGFIKTRYMPEVTLYNKQRDIQYPFEVYHGVVGGNKVLVVLHNEMPVERERTAYAEYLASLAKKWMVREAILVGGLNQELREDQGEKFRWIPINNPTIVFNNARLLEDRHIIGVLALLIMFMKAQGLKGVVILPFTEPYRPDPRASAVAVEVISGILGVEVSVQRLMEEASIIEAIEAERAKIEKATEEAEKKSRLSYI